MSKLTLEQIGKLVSQTSEDYITDLNTVDKELHVALKRLHQLETDLVEGKLIELPCNAGDIPDIFYEIEKGKIYEWAFDGIRISAKDNIRLSGIGHDESDLSVPLHLLEIFGVFFTKSDAEKALEAE